MMSYIRPPLRRLRLVALTMMALITLTMIVQGQTPDTSLPVLPAYNLGNTEFLIGAYESRPHTLSQIDSMWAYFDSLGVDVPYLGGLSNEQIDTLADSSDQWWHTGRRFMAHGLAPFVHAGYGRQVQFFPFDSVESPYWKCLFTNIVGGDVDTNHTEGDKLERLFSNLSDAGLIASDLAVNYTSSLDLVKNKALLSQQNTDASDARTYYFTVTGHLFDSLNASNTSAASVFNVAIYHKIPQNETYLGDDLQTHTASTGTVEILVDSFEVTRGELLSDTTKSRNQYRTISHPVDLRHRFGDTTLVGPLHPNQPGGRSQALDIRVYWTGAEKAALRSVAVRDSIGELVLGDRPESHAYMAALLTAAKRILKGTDTSDSAPLRLSIMRLEVGHENNESQYAAFNAIDRLLRENFNKAPHADARDSVAAMMIEGGYRPEWHQITDQRENYLEAYFNEPHDTSLTTSLGWNNPAGQFHVPYHQIPSIAQHNGGSLSIPRLEPTSAGIEDYETTIQRSYFGRQTSSPTEWPYAQTHISGLKRAADDMRATHRRMVIYLGPIQRMYYRVWVDSTIDGGTVTYDTVARDTTTSHLPEAAELRELVNLTLAYSARGIIWWTLNQDRTMTPLQDDTLKSYESCCAGPRGEGLWDFDNNFADQILRTVSDTLAVVDSLYTGSKNLMDAIRWIDKDWLTTVGSELMKLRWRDAYSIHTTGTWVEDGSVIDWFERPIPSSEIISEVKSYRPGDSVADEEQRTFVEVGLFDTHPDSSSLHLDTNYLFITNRRTFERPADIDSTSDLGRLMDTLAEVRRISVKLNLQRPTFDQYEFVRVREIAPDLTPLPLSHTPRVPLDTIVGVNRTVNLVLRPGGATLLEISYLPPDTSFIRAGLEFNNGRRIVFDGVHYHMTFFRRDTVRNPGNLDSLTDDNYVYYRRSFPIGDTGPVQWEPIDTLPINFDGPSNTRFDNRHPSITVHTTSSDTVATIVWTAENHDPGISDTNIREVCLRNIHVNNYSRQKGSIEWVEDYYHHDFTHMEPTATFGTPVVESLAGGYGIVWSDAVGGIRARLRLRPASTGWWLLTGSYSGVVDISDTFQNAYGFRPGRYPTIPSIGHRAAGDSSIAIAWEQPWANYTSMIYYYRLRQFPSMPGPIPVLGSVPNNYRLNLSTGGGFNIFPSTDGTQDMWWRLQEVVAWESQENLYDRVKDINYQNKFLNLRSMYTDPSGRSWRWGEIMYRIASKVGAFNRPIHASIASLNDLLVPADSLKRLYFSVVYQSPDSGSSAKMWQGKYWYTVDFADDFPQKYAFAGTNPNASAAVSRQSDRQAVLYETPESSATVARTSREFFAKQRPSGYRAQGRRIGLSLGDSLTTDVEAWLYDPWFANDSTSLPLKLVERDTTYRFTNTLPMAQQLLRTENFHSHDSTQIGLELYSRYYGTIAAADSGRIMMVAELIDSADGSVVQQLDSFCISGSATDYYKELEPTYDLLSGTYYIRLRIDTVNVPSPYLQNNSRYPVAEMRGDVESGEVGKVRRIRETEGTRNRISAQPNPFASATELRFSVAEAGYATVRIYDALGRPVAEPLTRRWMESGRFALDFDSRGLPNGTYMVELRTDRERIVEKLVVAR